MLSESFLYSRNILEKADAFKSWLSQIMPLRKNILDYKFTKVQYFRLICQLLSSLTTSTAFIKQGIFYSRSFIMKKTTLLYISFLLFFPINSPTEYSVQFCKFILSNKRITFREMLPFPRCEFAALMD